MNNPLVSVVIAAYNAQEYVGDTVKSVLAQTMDDLELIVVNDGSTDSTRDVLGTFEGDRRVRVIDQENTGCSAARNRGVEHSTGQYIAIVDADDVCWPKKLERQLDVFRRDPTLGVVGTHARMIDPQSAHLGILRTPTDTHAIAEGMKESMQFCHPTVMIRRDIYCDLGGYDERYPTSEDYEFLRRVVDRHRAINIPDVLYDLRIHGDRKSFYLFEQQRFRGFLTRHLMENGRPYDDRVQQRFGTELSRKKLVAAGICEESIDRQMISDYIHRIQMLDRLGQPEKAAHFVRRAHCYARRHGLGRWANAELRALHSLRALKYGKWRRSVAAAVAAGAVKPTAVLRRYWQEGRFALHRWHTQRALDTASAPPRSTSEMR